jgi:hypothetical protein
MATLTDPFPDDTAGTDAAGAEVVGAEASAVDAVAAEVVGAEADAAACVAAALVVLALVSAGSALTVARQPHSTPAELATTSSATAPRLAITDAGMVGSPRVGAKVARVSLLRMEAIA